VQDFTKTDGRENEHKNPLKFRLNQNQGLGQMFSWRSKQIREIIPNRNQWNLIFYESISVSWRSIVISSNLETKRRNQLEKRMKQHIRELRSLDVARIRGKSRGSMTLLKDKGSVCSTHLLTPSLFHFCL